jgi:hypothetical protein
MPVTRAITCSRTWEERSWLNVPGPFYGAETDTCGTGRLAAPSNVLYTEDGQEFIWKQPQNPEQVRAVLMRPIRICFQATRGMATSIGQSISFENGGSSAAVYANGSSGSLATTGGRRIPMTSRLSSTPCASFSRTWMENLSCTSAGTSCGSTLAAVELQRESHRTSSRAAL